MLMHACAAAVLGFATGTLSALAAPAASSSLPALGANGRFLVDNAGKKVVLKGCNLGNWLLIEPWMLGLREEFRDQHDMLARLQSRFGVERAGQLLDVYRENWITAREMKLIRSFGFNVVRVPFHHSLLADEASPLQLRKDAFDWLDRAVDLAEQAGIYVILDMHGVPGGQSIDAPTGQVNVNALWNDPTNQERTAWLWQRVAEHYRDCNSVVAYDLINEPWGDFKTDVRPGLLSIVGRLHDAIRRVDANKLIFAPGSLRGIAFYGRPHDRGWKNVGFTEHFYPGLFGQGSPSLETHARFFAFTIPTRRQMLEQLNVPYLIGEFNVVLAQTAKPEMMRRYYDTFGQAGWLATMWSARMLNPQGGVQPDSWYLMANAEPFRLPDFNTASAEQIEQAFHELGTMPLAVDEPLRTALTTRQPERIVLADFSPVRVASPGQPPTGWKSIDIAATLAGSVRQLANGAIEICGAGGDLWDKHDEFHFVHREVTGDFAAHNQLTTLAAPHPYSKAGWMLRASMQPDATHVLVHAFPDGRVMLAWRANNGGETKEQTLCISGSPVGLGIERAGKTIRVRYTDVDGRWHTQTAPADVQMPDKALLGLVVMSHEETVLARATFDRIVDETAPRDEARAATPAEANLLKNGSFELVDNAKGDDRAANWDRWGQWFNRESSWKPVRDGSCLLGYHHWQIESAENSGVWQDVAGLNAGMRYTFSVDANADKSAAGKHGAESVELRIESRYDGRLLNVASQTYQGDDIATGNGWSRLSVSGTLPADNARMLIVVNPSRTAPRDAALKFDRAYLWAQPVSAEPVNLADNSATEKEEDHD